MSYYQGDYYRGGFFGSLFRGIGGLARGVLGLPSAPRAAPAQIGPANPFGAGMTSLGPVASNVIRGGRAIIAKHPVLTAAASAGVLALAGGGAALARRGKAAPGIASAMGVKKHRRMHVTNVRALRRAIRRTHGFAKLAMKVIRIEHPRKHGKFGGYRRRKKSRI